MYSFKSIIKSKISLSYDKPRKLATFALKVQYIYIRKCTDRQIKIKYELNPFTYLK